MTAAPPILRSVWAEGSTPGDGAIRVVTGVGTRFHEEITGYDPPRSYGYRVIRSFPPFEHEGGTLTFTLVEGGTNVDWVATYTHPTYAGGGILAKVSAPLLRWVFGSILAGCAKALEGSSG